MFSNMINCLQERIEKPLGRGDALRLFIGCACICSFIFASEIAEGLDDGEYEVADLNTGIKTISGVGGGFLEVAGHSFCRVVYHVGDGVRRCCTRAYDRYQQRSFDPDHEDIDISMDLEFHNATEIHNLNMVGPEYGATSSKLSGNHFK